MTYQIYPHIRTPTDLGNAHLGNPSTAIAPPKHPIDRAKYGRTLAQMEGGIFTSRGYVVPRHTHGDSNNYKSEKWRGTTVDNKTSGYASGADCWNSNKESYGVITARITCLRYLDLQAQNKDDSEREFCRELREAMTMERNFRDVDVYLHNSAFAKYNCETELYDESDRLNRLCADDIDAAIRACEYGDGTHKFEAGLTALTEQYGAERLSVVLAAEAKWQGFMGHLPDDVYQWALSFNLGDHFYGGFHLRTRPAILGEFIDCLRETTERTRSEGLGVPGHTQPYQNGADYWRDLKDVSIDLNAALAAGGRYIGEKMKAECTDDEKRFCHELFSAMYTDIAETVDEFKTVYPHDYSTAYSNGEDSLFTKSRELGESCATRIDYLINASQYKPQHYNLELAAMRAVHDYGFDRVNMVLARNIQVRSSDGRFSGSNKQWAQDALFPEQAFEGAVLNAHPILIEDFARYTRKLYDEVGAEQFARHEREENGELPTIEGDKPSVLKQIRDAQKNPSAPRGEKTQGHRKNKGEAEH